MGNCFLENTNISCSSNFQLRPMAMQKRFWERGTIISNSIHHVAAEYYGAVGILSTFNHNVKILHKDIYHVFYSCMSIGWGWWSRAPLALSAERMRVE